MSNKAYYHATIREFLITSSATIRGTITTSHTQNIDYNQTRAWMSQIENLQHQLAGLDHGYIAFELLIPRMGRRVDAVILYNGIIFVLEYKVGKKTYDTTDERQALGYALDLKHFHSSSHDRVIIPLLIATRAKEAFSLPVHHDSGVTEVIYSNGKNLSEIISQSVQSYPNENAIDLNDWLSGSYQPTPTIIEAAKALYAKHDVKEISRSDAGAVNLAQTSKELQSIIDDCQLNNQKAICFVTGVPGAGKTLVGLNIASNNSDKNKHPAVLLSGNAPLVDVLREALAKDKQKRVNDKNDKKLTIAKARQAVETQIQKIHHFRNDYIKDKSPPPEKIAIFDEAQRAWTAEATKAFMVKKGHSEWNQSEPEFLISIMDRHKDWSVIIALIGGGQEINKGEAGLQGWLDALQQSFKDWRIYYSPELKQSTYAGNGVNLDSLEGSPKAESFSSLHLSTSMRSFRAEKLSNFIHYLIGNQPDKAHKLAAELLKNYPLRLTRDVKAAKAWIKSQTRGTERSGLIASSGAKRLKADGIFVLDKDKSNHKVWFLNPPDDVRSSNFLEDAMSEFVVQGLELDWCLVGWDADYRYVDGSFKHWNFSGNRWENINKHENKYYLENAYRVLLTRARQGMVIFVPHGDINDETRKPEFYDQTYSYLLSCGMEPLD